jgi:hypothetical protein
VNVESNARSAEELMRFYSSFLVRCWFTEDALGGDRPVLQIEHIQSGGHTRVASLTEAEEWILAAAEANRNKAVPEEEEK